MTNLIKNIKNELDGKAILILGFGREGKATYEFIKKYVDYSSLAIADKNEIDLPEKTFCGKDYCENLSGFDVVIKSPGIAYKDLKNKIDFSKVISETELVLKYYRKNMIGVTGTKGKSTTSSLIYAILQEAKMNSRLVGNIGVPLFQCLENMTDETILVCEMSSHQLENVTVSPHIGVFLNLFEDHLDHYNSYEDYQLAKVNIFRHQSFEDYVVYNEEHELVKAYVENYAQGKRIAFPFPISFSNQLVGEHNQKNISVAVSVAKILGVSEDIIEKAISEFRGLPHRLEFVGTYDGVLYYNDSISTIPEATMNAVESLKDVDTLILGGMDRGIHYDSLVSYLNEGKVRNVVLAYETGKRIAKELVCEGVYLVEDLAEAVKMAKELTMKNKICLLSPAAASYGYFKNFEERGERFKELIKA